MYHSINAGRLRDYVEIFDGGVTSDEFGQTVKGGLVFDARAEVKFASGKELHDYGTTTTSTIITVLMWFDERANDTQLLAFNGVEYHINHIKPDNARKSMILTCEVIKK